MKFFWKIFISTMLISVVFFSVGSYFLINLGFYSAIKREVTAAYDENEVLYYSLNREFKNIANKSLLPTSVIQEGDLEKIIFKTAQSVTINTSKGAIPYRLSDNKRKIIFDCSSSNISSKLLTKLSVNKKGYEILKSDTGNIIHTAVPLSLHGTTLYIEGFKDISYLFENRNQQYKAYLYIILSMIFISAIAVIIVSGWLVRPIFQLSRAAKKIGDGDFSQRVPIKSADEIGKLSQEFNAMASRLEQTVEELKDVNLRQENFIGSFAHELKTPLTSIIGYSDMLRSKRLKEEQIVLSANYIFSESKRLEALSMKLLDMILLKKQDFTIKRVSARDFFESIKGIILPALGKENIIFEMCIEDAVLNIEPDLMKTVCINLLDNARKAILSHGRITLTGKFEGDCYLIIIQ
ncbi:MAG TPA: HAMP domain-containing sensor histidine kinase, partial [Clostridia bacterium]|nr:HAMP domain-containing sensor histidine kinase [Clostridia bacterium]